MLFKDSKEMLEWLRLSANQADLDAKIASDHNNNTPWIGQINPRTGCFVDYMQEDHETGKRLNEVADFIQLLLVLCPDDVKEQIKIGYSGCQGTQSDCEDCEGFVDGNTPEELDIDNPFFPANLPEV